MRYVNAEGIEIEPSPAWSRDSPLIEQIRFIGQRPGMWFGSSRVANY